MKKCPYRGAAPFENFYFQTSFEIGFIAFFSNRFLGRDLIFGHILEEHFCDFGDEKTQHFWEKFDYTLTTAQWIQSFFNHCASTALAIGAKLLLKYPFTTFVKAKS